MPGMRLAAPSLRLVSSSGLSAKNLRCTPSPPRAFLGLFSFYFQVKKKPFVSLALDTVRLLLSARASPSWHPQKPTAQRSLVGSAASFSLRRSLYPTLKKSLHFSGLRLCSGRGNAPPRATPPHSGCACSSSRSAPVFTSASTYPLHSIC